MPNEFNSNNGDTYSMTLSSHPGKALVLSNHSVESWGNTENYLVLGDLSQAIKLFFTKQSTGYLIRLNEKRT